MSDRTELLEATLDCLPEGIVLLDQKCLIQFWNQAAEAITGYSSAEMLQRQVPPPLETLLPCGPESGGTMLADNSGLRHGALVSSQHKLGHAVPVMARRLLLRDGMGGRIGMAVVFHPAESLDALPHGETGDEPGIQASQADLDERLISMFEDFSHGGQSFGVLWITVDQAHDLRKTHGAKACESMLEKVEHALTRGLRPAELMGRWGEDEFLVVSHERTAEMLADHARMLAGLARTADFRWWGDRVSLTVSIGVAQAELTGSLVNLLERAKAAMFSSFHAGGNQITSAPGGQECSPS